MNKKEVSEIKKLFKFSNCSITRMTGCYVDGEGNIKTKFAQNFLALPEEEILFYLEILKKSLSGTVEKNLHTLEFPSVEEMSGGKQEAYMRLRDSKLRDTEILDEYYNKIIEAHPIDGNYLILLFHDMYDIPGKSMEGHDESEEVFEYVMTCICPVTLQKATLSFADDGNFHQPKRQWALGMPEMAFMFPAFNDRSTDVHNILCYEKKPENENDDLLNMLIGKVIPLSAEDEKNVFNALLEDTLGDDCGIDIIKNIHEKLSEKIEVYGESSEGLILDKNDIKRVLEDSDVPAERLRDFEGCYDAVAGEKTKLTATNIINAKVLEFKMPDVVVKVKPDRSDLVETQMVNGRKCLVIELDSDVTVNGIQVRK